MTGHLKSVQGMEDVVQEKIRKEVVAGRVVGLFSDPSVPRLRVSLLGIVSQKPLCEFRLIHHLSYPAGESVNGRIPQELCTVWYTSFDAAVCMVRACGHGVEMMKCDIKSAFHLLPVHPADFELFGFVFDRFYYMDRALPMGCSISHAAFECFSFFLEWVFKVQGRDTSCGALFE